MEKHYFIKSLQITYEPEGILVNSVVINNNRYADDTVLLATSEEGLQALITIAYV